MLIVFCHVLRKFHNNVRLDENLITTCVYMVVALFLKTPPVAHFNVNAWLNMFVSCLFSFDAEHYESTKGIWRILIKIWPCKDTTKVAGDVMTECEEVLCRFHCSIRFLVYVLESNSCELKKFWGRVKETSVPYFSTERGSPFLGRIHLQHTRIAVAFASLEFFIVFDQECFDLKDNKKFQRDGYTRVLQMNAPIVNA